MTLTLADANRVIAGVVDKAGAIGAKMNIAVCDAGGRLVAFQRKDGAMWAGSFGSQGKAIASAAFGRPSGELTARAEHPTLRGIAMAEGNHMFYGQGAVPIWRDGVLIGACGVGGGTAQEDEDCAKSWRRENLAAEPSGSIGMQISASGMTATALPRSAS